MDPHLQDIRDFLLQAKGLEPGKKKAVSASLDATAAQWENITRKLEQERKTVERLHRELEIEAALERVRVSALSMHRSEDLSATISVFYHELESWMVLPRRCGVGLLNRESPVARISTMNRTEQGEYVEIVGTLNLTGHPVLEGIYEHWLQQKEYHPVLRGNEIREYYQLVRPQISYPDYPHDTVQYGYFFFFTDGGVVVWTETELQEEELTIFRRFTSVLGLTYKRYKDIVNAEERAQVAIRQAALDRVRAEIASMRTAEDLQRITPAVWRELKALDVPFFRCGVFIINEQEEKIHVYLSTPEGNPLAVLHLRFTSSGTTMNVLNSWRAQTVYREHWDREQFLAWVKSLMEEGQIREEHQYQGGEVPPESLTLQFVPFVQGMLYVGSAGILSDAQIEAVQALAEAFSTAYARYEDFIRIEEAKRKIEATYNELKATQSQLIQSEKMASLGELTAGIAHEIQNPLNFVNNFSDVSNELIEEMEEELAAGHQENAIGLAGIIKENLGKISVHGKRADAIVKGMLQHSRMGSGQKELTDINALTDEYVRLAYHGLRARESRFSAIVETDLDPSLEKISVVPQDIGRVLLNLVNNAFYAVGEKQKKLDSEFEPTIHIRTKKSGDRVLITVEDNGNGIPKKIKDKIFQPFFTTKPTGQGTGLGLSLSYDIVKGHGGEIRVDTKEGEGTTFTVQL